MKKNMGTFDRTTRILLAIIMGALYFTNTVTGGLGIVLMVLAVIFLLTSFVSFCPLYAIFGFTTCKTKRQKV
jgi:Inner membrane protein YgaP-like, transmembrane domain